MTSNGEAASAAGPVLRAVASLLTALSHQSGERPAPDEPEPVRYAPRPDREPVPVRASDDLGSMIEEARERAQRILDEAVERARVLSRPPAPSQSTGATGWSDLEAGRQFDELRRSIASMSDDVRDVQQRLARIEAMLGGTPVEETPPLTPRRGVASPPAAYTSPPPFPQPSADIPQPLTPARPLVVPPPPLPPPPPTPSVEPPAVESHEVAAETTETGDVPVVTFVPEDGSVLVRVTPVAGFQGLMRVQDALARLRGVRQTAVEAYSQGEARLRLELTDRTDSEEIADGLAGTLSTPVQVRNASEAERSMLIVLG